MTRPLLFMTAPTGRLLAALSQDLRYAARALWKQPGFSAVAVLTLALGIGATTAIFSVVYGVLLKPLPFDEPDRLVAVYHRAPGFNAPTLPQSAATYFTYRDHARVFEDIGLWRAEQVSIARSGTPETEQALRVTDGLLSLLRVRPFLGDLLRKEDDVPGAPNRVLLTYGYWQRAFGASRDVVGQSLVIDGSPYEVVGVLPASFKFLDTRAAVLLPLRPNRTQASAMAGFGPGGVARLKPGVTLAEANDDIARMIPLIPEQFPLPPAVTQRCGRASAWRRTSCRSRRSSSVTSADPCGFSWAPSASFSSWRGPTWRTCCSCAPRGVSGSLPSVQRSARAAAALPPRCCRSPSCWGWPAVPSVSCSPRPASVCCEGWRLSDCRASTTSPLTEWSCSSR